MTQIELFVYAVGSLGTLFLLCGLAMLVFGSRKKVPNSKTPKIVVKIGKYEMSVPYTTSIFTCIIGVVLILIAYNVVKEGGVPEQISSGLWISSVYAQTSTPEPNTATGWVYFGDESRPKKWNFEILGGGYRDLYEQRAGIVLKALRSVNIRENHFGSFTGTVLGFLSPEPRVLGMMSQGTCAVPEEIVSVGFNKIWVKAKPVACPQ